MRIAPMRSPYRPRGDRARHTKITSLMKAALLICFLAIAALLCGCNVSTETAATQTPGTQASEKPAQPQENAPTAPENAKQLPPAPAWRTLYRDKKKDDIRGLFDRARELVEQQKGVKGEIDVWSAYFGPWFVIKIKPEPQNPDTAALDAPSPKMRAYLVDMNHEEVIETGDWRSAKPFFDALIDVFEKGFDNSDDKVSFIDRFASAASVVGLGHAEYVENPQDGVKYPSPVTGPKLASRMGKYELVYYVQEGGMTLSYTRCTLTVTHTNIIFNAEIAELN